MALTFRTGSDSKGSALTIEELDNNFRHFTGSHPIEGDLTITGSITVSGSENSVFDIDLFDLVITGGLDVSRDVVVGDDLTVVDETTLKKETTIGYQDFSNYDFSYQLNVTASSNSDKSARFDGGIVVSGSSLFSGSIIPAEVEATLGTQEKPWKELFVSNGSIVFVSGSTTSSFGIDPSGSLSGSFDGDYTGSFTGSIDSQFNTGSCLIGCVGSVPPTGSRPEGTFEFMVSASVQTMYVYLDGAWRDIPITT